MVVPLLVELSGGGATVLLDIVNATCVTALGQLALNGGVRSAWASWGSIVLLVLLWDSNSYVLYSK